jgi:hypothetical protein
VGQQALQGSHLAPSAFLHRLHDTHLESASAACMACQLMAYHSAASLGTAPTACTVVICLPPMPICLVLSCEAPQGSLLAFAPGNVVDNRRNQYLLHYRAAFAFSLTCCPHRYESILR